MTREMSAKKVLGGKIRMEWPTDGCRLTHLIKSFSQIQTGYDLRLDVKTCWGLKFLTLLPMSSISNFPQQILAGLVKLTLKFL